MSAQYPDESPVPDRSLFTLRSAVALKAGDYLIYRDQVCYVRSVWTHGLPLVVEFDLHPIPGDKPLIAVQLPALESVSSYQEEIVP
jgi:hypothetical protein